MPIPPFSNPSGASNISDSDLQSYLGRGGGQSAFNGTEINALALLVKDLKDTGLWRKLIAFYPFAGRAAIPAAQNLISSAYPLKFNGSWQFASWGARNAGRGAYADTGFYPVTGFLMTQAGQNGIPASPNVSFRSGSFGCHLLQNYASAQVTPQEFYQNPTGVYGYCTNGSSTVTCSALPWALTAGSSVTGSGIPYGTTVSAASSGATSITLSTPYTGVTGYQNLTIQSAAVGASTSVGLQANNPSGTVVANFPAYSGYGTGTCTNAEGTFICSFKNSAWTDSTAITNPDIDSIIWQGTSSGITSVYSKLNQNVGYASGNNFYTYSGSILIGGQYYPTAGTVTYNGVVYPIQATTQNIIDTSYSQNFSTTDKPFNCAFLGYGLSQNDAASLNTIMFSFQTNRAVNFSSRMIVTQGDSIMSAFLSRYSNNGLPGIGFGAVGELLFNKPFSELTPSNLLTYAIGGTQTTSMLTYYPYTAGNVQLTATCTNGSATINVSALPTALYAKTIVTDGSGYSSTVATTVYSGATSVTLSTVYTGTTGSKTLTFTSPAYGAGNTFIVWAGTNNLGQQLVYNGSQTTANSTADTAYSNLQNIWALARRDGYWTVAFTVLKRSDFPAGTTQDNARIRLNNNIKASVGTYVDQVIDVESVFSYADVTSTSSFTPPLMAFDNGATISGAPQVYNNGSLATGSYVHPTTVGQQKIWAYVAQYLK